ncbi:FAD:protein FMN transferase [Agaribacterium haliotis]|uniref:FAD:protein FMN transferase n=1 Tax=Agaribacterium haliotis TaxID=2013869 RepID=UPI000BB53295|nr:FAD:protein FMN transferase [Agaribacterium haliotis]
MNVSVNTLGKRLVYPAFFCCLLLLAACSERKSEQWQLQGPTMGTTYHVKLTPTDTLELDRQALQAQLDTELQAINQSMSTYIADSELNRFNHASVGEWFRVEPQLCQLMALAGEIYRASDGAFDPTVGPLVNLWGFGPEARSSIPSEEALANVRERIGYDALELNCSENLVRKHKALYIDLSAIAKGWAVDHLAAYLDALGVRSHMVEIGGELSLSGLNAQAQAWRIAVEKPVLGQGSAAQILALSDVAVATSGDYRNYFEENGKRYSHTIDPGSGAPITHKLASVTVIAASSAEADAWATALNVLGPERGRAVADKLQLAAYFIVRGDDGFDVNYTQAFEKYMVK